MHIDGSAALNRQIRFQTTLYSAKHVRANGTRVACFKRYLEDCPTLRKSGLVDGKELAADGTYLPATVSKDSWIDTEVETELSMQSYLDRLDEELSKQPGFKRPPAKTIRKHRTTSKTDLDSGCINHGKKSEIDT